MKAKNSLFVGITIFGTLVGAGFASGKEIWFYFARFGWLGFLCAFLICVLFFFACLLFFSFGKKFQIKTVQGCFETTFGKMGAPFEFLLVLCNLLLLSSMFAGADSLFEIVVPNFPYRLAGVLSAIATILVVCFGFSGITKTNAFVVPMLFLMILLVGAFSLGDGAKLSTKTLEASGVFKSFLSSFLFLGSNMFFSGFMFAKMGSSLQKKEIFWGSFLGALMLFVAVLIMLFILFSNPSSVASNMPVVEIALNNSLALGVFVLVVIWFGLLTTSFALLLTLSNWLKTYFGNPLLMTILASLVALLFSGIGFSLFVQFVYPIMGIFGFVFMFFVFLAQKRKSKNKKDLKLKTKNLKNTKLNTKNQLF